MIIAGVDGALSSTGLAVLNAPQGKVQYLGKIITSKCKATPDESSRLKLIYNEFVQFLNYHRPDVVVAEDQFVGRNMDTAKVLSRVRGVIQLTCALYSVPFRILQPNQIKLHTTGIGNASKDIVQQSIVELYKHDPLVQKTLSTIILTGKNKTDDIADALAIAHTYSIEPSSAVTA